jgi:hypothetical protein
VNDCVDGLDEENCSFFSQLNIFYTSFFSCLLFIEVYALYLCLIRYTKKRPTEFFTNKRFKISKFLTKTSWLKVKTQTKSKENVIQSNDFEKIIFNKSNIFFIQFLEILDFESIHPNEKYDLVLKLQKHMSSQHGFLDEHFFVFISSKIGLNKLTVKFL